MSKNTVPVLNKEGTCKEFKCQDNTVQWVQASYISQRIVAKNKEHQVNSNGKST